MSIVINVMCQGERFFSTSRGSCKTKAQAAKLVTTFKDRFPEEEGFTLSVFELKSEATELNPAFLDEAAEIAFDPVNGTGN